MITTSSAGGSSPVIFFLEFLYVRTFCAVYCVIEYANATNGDANLEAHDKSANMLVLSLVGVLVMNSPEPLSLQGGYGGCTIRFFVRLVVHLLLVGGRCSWISFVGLLYSDRRLLEMCLASVSSTDGDCSWRSTIQLRIALLMGLKFEVFSSNRKSAGSVFLDLLHGGRWRRTRMQQQWSETAKSTGYFSCGLMCIFYFLQGVPGQGLNVKVLYQ